MIGDALSYRLSDFVMVSARVYDRQIVLHNVDLFGLQVVTVLLGIGLVWQTLRPHAVMERAIPPALGLVWLWVAASFLWQRYGDVNLIARWAAPAFALQGVALMAAGLHRHGLNLSMPDGWRRLVLAPLLIMTLIVYPLLSPLIGKPVLAAEFFALMPDPTALGTLCLLALSRRPLRYPLIVVPTVWCIMSAATLWVLGSTAAPVVAAIAALAVALTLVRPGGPLR